MTDEDDRSRPAKTIPPPPFFVRTQHITFNILWLRYRYYNYYYRVHRRRSSSYHGRLHAVRKYGYGLCVTVCRRPNRIVHNNIALVHYISRTVMPTRIKYIYLFIKHDYFIPSIFFSFPCSLNNNY